MSHSRRCQVRWALTTWVAAMVGVALYLLVLRHLPSGREVLVNALLGLIVSLVAVLVLARLPALVAALLVTTAAGFLTGYGWGLLTYGSGTEDGTVWRGYGGAVVGAVSALVAWAVMRTAHRTLSQGMCRQAPASALTP